MNRAAAIACTFLLAMVAVFLTGGGGGVDACDNVPTMSIDEACSKACTNYTTPRLQVCQSTLRNGGLMPNANMADFTVAAAMAARGSYEPSMRKVNETLENPALPMDVRRAYDDCQRKYGEAHELVMIVVKQVSGCYDLASAPQELFDASTSVWSCGNGLAALQLSSAPLFAMNLADQELTMLAYHLGGLIVGS